MSITKVQAAANYTASGSESVTALLSSALTTGNAVLVFVRSGSSAVASVNDVKGNSYSKLTSTQWGASPNPSDRTAEVWYALNITGGATEIEVAFAANSSYGNFVTAVEYSGVSSLSAPAGATGRAGTIQSNSATLNYANTLVVANCWDSNDSFANTGVGSGWTADSDCAQASQTGGSGNVNLFEHQVLSSGTVSATASGSHVDDWCFQMVLVQP